MSVASSGGTEQFNDVVGGGGGGWCSEELKREAGNGVIFTFLRVCMLPGQR